mgnify:CR=1 FL=1
MLSNNTAEVNIIEERFACRLKNSRAVDPIRHICTSQIDQNSSVRICIRHIDRHIVSTPANFSKLTFQFSARNPRYAGIPPATFVTRLIARDSRYLIFTNAKNFPANALRRKKSSRSFSYPRSCSVDKLVAIHTTSDELRIGVIHQICKLLDSGYVRNARFQDLMKIHDFRKKKIQKIQF